MPTQPDDASPHAIAPCETGSAAAPQFNEDDTLRVTKAQKIDPKLLEFLVCPLTLGPLEYDRERQLLISRSAKLVYPIKDGIPIMLPDAAEPLAE